MKEVSGKGEPLESSFGSSGVVCRMESFRGKVGSISRLSTAS